MSTLFAFPASIIPQAHTVIAALAFTTALFMGWAGGLWKDLCDNAVSSGSNTGNGHTCQS